MAQELTLRQQQRKMEWEATHPSADPKAQSRRAKRTPRQRFARTWTISALVVIVACLIVGDGPDPGKRGAVCAGIALVAMITILVPWLCWAGWQIGGQIGNSIHAAATPIPSPDEISWQLQQEWGRQPTVEEVQAVHQMLTSEHNQALLAAGIGVGAIYLINRNL